MYGRVRFRPLCKCEKYVEANGNWYTTEFFKCFGCSAMFTDPLLFSQSMVAGDGVDRSPRSFDRRGPGEDG